MYFKKYQKYKKKYMDLKKSINKNNIIGGTTVNELYMKYNISTWNDVNFLFYISAVFILYGLRNCYICPANLTIEQMTFDEIQDIKGLLYEIYENKLEYKEGTFLIYDDIEKKYIQKENAILIQQVGVELNYDALGFGIDKDPQVNDLDETYLGQQLGFDECSGNIQGKTQLNIYYARLGLNIMNFYCNEDNINTLTKKLIKKLQIMKENINTSESERNMFITDELNVYGGTFFFLLIHKDNTDEKDDIIIKI